MTDKVFYWPGGKYGKGANAYDLEKGFWALVNGRVYGHRKPHTETQAIKCLKSLQRQNYWRQVWQRAVEACGSKANLGHKLGMVHKHLPGKKCKHGKKCKWLGKVDHKGLYNRIYDGARPRTHLRRMKLLALGR